MAEINLQVVRRWRAELAKNDANPHLGGWTSVLSMVENGDIDHDEFSSLLEFAENALLAHCLPAASDESNEDGV
jgi:hypothetical protein